MLSQNILSKSALKQIERQRTRVLGKKIVTDDIRKLKSLASTPMIPKDKIHDYYVEPVVIEYYIPKESRFAQETKYMYIELIDPQPKNENQEQIFAYFNERNQPIDTMEVMNAFPMFLVQIMEYYTPSLSIYEAISLYIKQSLEGDHAATKKVLYLNEVLRKSEPTVPALEILGDYTTFNINWCVRTLNRNRVPHSLEDRTVAYLIKLHVMQSEATGKPLDDRFEVLSQIYLEQAFPLADEELYEDIDFDDEF